MDPSIVMPNANCYRTEKGKGEGGRGGGVFSGITRTTRHSVEHWTRALTALVK